MIANEETRTAVREARTRRKLSQRALATISHSSLFAVNSAETGKSHVSLETLARISLALDIRLVQVADAQAQPEGQFITPAEAAHQTGLGHARIRQLLRGDDVPGAYKTASGQWMIPLNWAQRRRPRPRGPQKGERETAPSTRSPARALARARRAMGIAPDVLAADSEFDLQRLQNAETGADPLSPAEARRLAPYLGTDPAALTDNPSRLPPPDTIPAHEAAWETGLPEEDIRRMARQGQIPHAANGDGDLYIAVGWCAVAASRTGYNAHCWYTPSQHAVATGRSRDRIMQLVAEGAYTTYDAVVWNCHLEGPTDIRPAIEDLELIHGRWQEDSRSSPCRHLAHRAQAHSQVSQAIAAGDLKEAAGQLWHIHIEISNKLLSLMLDRSPMLSHATARTLLRLETLLEARTDARERPAHRLRRLSKHIHRCSELYSGKADEQELRDCLNGENRLTHTLQQALAQHPDNLAADTLAQAANNRRRPGRR